MSDMDDIISEVSVLVEDAIDFVESELESEWELAERYYQGETDLEIVENRSNVVKTEVRDAIRNTMPSIMRVLLHARKIVNYIPSSIKHGQWIEQQAEYVTQLFFKNDGYMQLYKSVLEALKLKIGPQKVYWEPTPRSTYHEYTEIPYTALQDLIREDDVHIIEYEVFDNEAETFNVKYRREYPNGKIRYCAVPNYEFFISRNCNSIEHALEQGVHGQRRVVTVAEAMDMGIEYDGDWFELDCEDPEQSGLAGSSQARRGYDKQDVNDPGTVDISAHKFLLTECYVTRKLEGDTEAKIYRFFFGGTSYQYLDHEEVEDSPYALIIPIPIPHTVYGHSIADLTIKEQDTSTSLLRATVDNAHAANNAKIAADPSRTNFDDLMNPALSAPIRRKVGDTIQIIQTPYTGQGNLHLLQYLDLDVQSKVGITKAAQGLDPDAMQSTDKNAVINTIQTAQGQTELMVRNIIETGLIRVFRLMLRLSVQHQDRVQLIKTHGNYLPVDLLMFDPDATATPAVGLGTASPQQTVAALSFVYQQQQAYMQTLGPNNPFTSYAKMYNTLEDLLEAQSLFNVGRYFNVVTPEVEKAWAQAQEKKQQALIAEQEKNRPADPSKAYVEVERLKAEVKQAELALKHAEHAEELRLKALKDAEDLDIERDKLVQSRVIELTKIDSAEKSAEIKREQDSNEKQPKPKASSGKSA